MIDGHTHLLGLIGWPVAHSLSPAMHNAAFEALGLNWRYVPLPTPPGQVAAAVQGLAALGFRGANVTVPHKQAVIPALDAVAPDAQALGAINTLVVERGPALDQDLDLDLDLDLDRGQPAVVRGHNTDAAGFVGALRDGGFDPGEKKAVVVGAGGAARAVVFGLLQAHAREIVVLNRTGERAEALVADMRQHAPDDVHLCSSALTPQSLVESARTADLLVNATVVGMWPHAAGTIWPTDIPIPAHLTVFDLVYAPLETRLLQQARAAGAHTLDGLGMLVRQGALAFEMWTGIPVPPDVLVRMDRVCRRLSGGSG
ncbi:MAG TPA: shikimate dehydrogenase [Chloroflexi bacterium]|nr:shikimate dehydrogenase [Chloroflexota bacterium]